MRVRSKNTIQIVAFLALISLVGYLTLSSRNYKKEYDKLLVQNKELIEKFERKEWEIEEIKETKPDGSVIERRTEKGSETKKEVITVEKIIEVEKLVESKTSQKNYSVAVSTPILNSTNTMKSLQITAGMRLLSSPLWIEAGWSYERKSDMTVGVRLEF